MCGGGGSAPRPPPVLPEAPRMPSRDASLRGSLDKSKQRRTAGGTILTSARGAEGDSVTASKTILGS